MKLTDPTEDQINAAVAEFVAGWKDLRHEEGEDVDIDAREIYPWAGVTGLPPDETKRRLIRHYTRSADAVLPLLEKLKEVGVHYLDGDWFVRCWSEDKNCANCKSFPLAACIALLRAKGIQVEFTK